MNTQEIEKYCSVGHGVCIYRKRVKKAQFIVQSIYVSGGNNGKYFIQVEFDPMTMLEQGEGLNYCSEGKELENIIVVLEEFAGSKISEWENYTKTGNAPFYDSEKITDQHYQDSWAILSSKYENGKSLLPKGLDFK